jgi:hypothetical protein
MIGSTADVQVMIASNPLLKFLRSANSKASPPKSLANCCALASVRLNTEKLENLCF